MNYKTVTKRNNIVFNPAEIATLGHEYIQYKHDHKEYSLAFPIPKLSNRVYPLSAGEVLSIIARPGHCKTGLMMMWARERARLIRESGDEKRVVVYATWEQSVEELNSFYVAAEQKMSITKMAKGDLTPEDFEKILSAAGARVSEPLFFIGHSVMRKSGRELITMNRLGDALDQIVGDGFTIDSLFVDYLQRIGQEKEASFFGFSGIMDDLKNTALGLGIPIVVGVQASREVEALKIQIPEMHHAQMTSNIEQSSDRVLSLVRPRRYKKLGEQFGNIIVNGNNQMLVSVLKQKLGEGNFAEWINFNPVYNKLGDSELENPYPDHMEVVA